MVTGLGEEKKTKPLTFNYVNFLELQEKNRALQDKVDARDMKIQSLHTDIYKLRMKLKAIERISSTSSTLKGE